MSSMYEPCCVIGATMLLVVLSLLVAINAWGALAFIIGGAIMGMWFEARQKEEVE